MTEGWTRSLSGDRFEVRSAGLEPKGLDPRAVRANIERLHAENPQGTVVIQADEDARTKVLIDVMDSARMAGVYDVAIAAPSSGT